MFPCFIFTAFNSPEAGNFGNLLTGLATCAAVIVAYVNLSTWRNQKVDEKKSEVAGRTLTAALRLHQAILFLTSPQIDSPDDPVEEAGLMKRSYKIRRDYRTRLQATAGDLENYFVAMNEAEVYLPDEINESLEKLWMEWVSVKVDIMIHAAGLDSGGRPDQTQRDAYQNVYGTSGKEKRKAIIDELKAQLKPIARLSDSKINNRGRSPASSR